MIYEIKRVGFWNIPMVIILAVVLAAFLMLVPILASSSSKLDKRTSMHTPYDKEYKIDTIPFVYVSKTKGMVGGSTAHSDVHYLGWSGIIQVSKEGTNGILYKLMQAHTDTAKFFKDLSKNARLPHPKRKLEDQGKAFEVLEYYPPNTTVCYFLPVYGYTVSSYESDKISAAVNKFIQDIDAQIALAKLSPAKPGIYIRAQRIPDFDPDIIKADVVMQYHDLISDKKLLNILENEMSLIWVSKETNKVVLTGNITISLGESIHLQIEKHMYIITPYLYKGGEDIP